MTAVPASLSKISNTTAPRISRYGFYCVLAFLFWTVLLRLVLPFGDEPDFTVRAVELIEVEDHPLWVPYHWMSGLLNEINVQSNCQPDASPVAILGSIDSVTCTQPIAQIIFRVVITVICTAPLLWIVVFRNAAHNILRLLGLRLKITELNERLDALGTALLIPGMIYYLGLLSHEQFSLVISLLISVVWGNLFLVLLLTIYTLALDLGNGTIILAFLAIYIIVFLSFRSMGLKGLGLILFGVSAFFLVGSYDLLGYVQALTILSGKAEAIYLKSLTADFLEKYPVFLRPVITYITATFMTPSGIKAAPVQLMFAVVGIIGINRLRKSFRNKINLVSVGKEPRLIDLGTMQLLTMIAALATVVGFGLMLPDYANAKYYMFLVPFVLLPFVSVFDRLPRLLFMNASCAVVLVFLGIQYA